MSNLVDPFIVIKHKDDKLVPRKAYKWISDDSVSECHMCRRSFSWFNRKHHCRSCGRIFCKACSSYTCKLNYEYERHPTPDKSTYIKSLTDGMISLTLSRSQSKFDAQKVCISCKSRAEKINNIWSVFKVMYILKLNVVDVCKLASVCVSWNRACTYYKSLLSNIQYHIPLHPYTQLEKIILWNNKHILGGHNRYIIHFIKSSVIQPEPGLKKIIKLLLIQDKVISCERLKCCDQCKDHLVLEDIIEILDIPLISEEPFFQAYIISEINRTGIEEIKCYLPILIHHMKNIDALYKCILNLSIRFYHVRMETFIEFRNIARSDDMYKKLLNKFILDLPKKLSQELIHTMDTFKFIMNNIHSPSNLAKVKNFKSPFSEIQYSGIGPNIKVKRSNSRPAVVSLVRDCGMSDKILFKAENMEKDYIMIKIIKLIDIILTRELYFNLEIITYDVYSLGDKYGIINLIDNAETIHTIQNYKRFSIQNFIIENNPGESIHAIRERFIYSTAVYCVITYLFGIGDRHLDNIMITREGSLFHIDYDYILDCDPKISSPKMKITADMIDCLGGVNSKYYESFLQTCTDMYNCIRKHASVFTMMLIHLSNAEKNQMDIREYIIKKFIPGQSDHEAKLELITQINKSDTYSQRIVDFMYNSKTKLTRFTF